MARYFRFIKFSDSRENQPGSIDPNDPNRIKCPTCNGRGRGFFVTTNPDNPETLELCPKCWGAGTVPKPKETTTKQEKSKKQEQTSKPPVVPKKKTGPSSRSEHRLTPDLIVPGEHDIPSMGDGKGWQDLFSQIATHYRTNTQYLFPTLEQFLDVNRDYGIRDKQNNLHSLRALVHQHLLHQTPTGVQLETLRRNHSSSNFKGSFEYLLKSEHKPLDLVIKDSDLPNISKLGPQESLGKLQELLSSATDDPDGRELLRNISLEDNPKAFEILGRMASVPEKGKIPVEAVDSSGNYHIKVPASNDVTQELRSRELDATTDEQRRRTINIIWSNEHGQKRDLKTFMRSLVPNQSGLPFLSNVHPIGPVPPHETKLDPHTASPEQVDTLLRQVIGSNDSDVLKQLERHYPQQNTVLGQLSSYTSEHAGRPFIPGVDSIGSTGIVVKHQHNGDTVLSTLSSFIKQHLYAQLEKNVPKGQLVFKNPADMTTEDLTNLIRHASGGSINSIDQYGELVDQDSPQRHKAVDIDERGYVLPPRPKAYANNFSEKPSEKTVASFNLEDIFKLMGGGSARTSQGLVPRVSEDTLDRVVSNSTENQFATAQQYRTEFLNAIENKEGLERFLGYKAALNKDNKFIALKSICKKCGRAVPPSSLDPNGVHKASLKKRCIKEKNIDTRPDRRLPLTTTAVVPLEQLFKQDLLSHWSRIQGHRTLEHVDIPLPDLSSMIEENSYGQFSNAEQDSIGTATTGRPWVDTPRGVVLGADRHNPNRSRGIPLWVTSNPQHSCDQCTRGLCTKCGTEVPRFKLDPESGIHKAEYEQECVRNLNTV